MRYFHKLALSSLTSLGLLLIVATGSTAQMTQESMAETNTGFRRIEQPLWAKALVTTGGLGLIGLELWWFVFSKPKSSQARAQDGMQEITIKVDDGGYEPNQIVVGVGLPVRLNFHRTDPSSCLEEVRLPDFRIAKTLPVNQTTMIDFTPDVPGRFEFSCGMNMFRGTIKVVANSSDPNTA